MQKGLGIYPKIKCSYTSLDSGGTHNEIFQRFRQEGFSFTTTVYRAIIISLYFFGSHSDIQLTNTEKLLEAEMQHAARIESRKIKLKLKA